MSAPLPKSGSELTRFIQAAGESDNIDAKGPIAWDSGPESAAIAKDLVAFANSRDGGVLVIGKSQTSSGGFDLVGMTDEQASSFETTKVATWINNRFSPPVRTICHHHEYKGRTFVIITVDEFDDIPILCTKSFQHPTNPKVHLLRDRTIYVRNANAESAPLNTVEELRELIGLATAKRGQAMLAMFESILKGRPLLSPKDHEASFNEQLTAIEKQLGEPYSEQLRTGAWRLVVRPIRFDAERWPEIEQLEEIVRRRSVRLRDQFPAYQVGTHAREWGICNDTYGETWTLARSGLFLCIRPYWENQSDFEGKWRNVHGDATEPRKPAGTWLDFKSNIYSITEMCMFSARYVEEYGIGEEVALTLEATSLNGRTLLATTPSIFLPPSAPCRASTFNFTVNHLVEELRAEWEEICAQAMKRFVDLVHGPGADISTFHKWIEKFKHRDF